MYNPRESEIISCPMLLCIIRVYMHKKLLVHRVFRHTLRHSIYLMLVDVEYKENSFNAEKSAEATRGRVSRGGRMLKRLYPPLRRVPV